MQFLRVFYLDNLKGGGPKEVFGQLSNFWGVNYILRIQDVTEKD